MNHYQKPETKPKIEAELKPNYHFRFGFYFLKKPNGFFLFKTRIEPKIYPETESNRTDAHP